MSQVEILYVSSADPVPKGLIGFQLEMPKTGQQSENHVFNLEGWVLSDGSLAVAVEVWYGDRSIRRVPLNVPRPDVAQHYNTTLANPNCGFWCMLGTIGFPPEFDLILRVIFEGKTESIAIATIRIRRDSLASAFWPKVQPLMITSLGRTGTTWLMRLLSVAPRIVTYNAYPYEMMPAKYWMHLLKVASEPANHLESAHWGNFSHSLNWIGQNPYFTAPLTDHAPLLGWFGKTYIENLAEFCQQSIQGFYQTLAETQGIPSPQYFVEKSYPDHTPWLMWDLYPKAREIILVRDFRDMVASIYATNAKRGTQDFGRSEKSKDEDYINLLATHAQHLRDSWKMRSNRAYLVRYEDLILKPYAILEGVLTYLGLDSTSSVIERILHEAKKDTPELSAHRTTSSPEASIGRWRTDLPDALKSVADKAFNSLLQTFGYHI